MSAITHHEATEPIGCFIRTLHEDVRSYRRAAEMHPNKNGRVSRRTAPRFHSSLFVGNHVPACHDGNKRSMRIISKSTSLLVSITRSSGPQVSRSGIKHRSHCPTQVE